MSKCPFTLQARWRRRVSPRDSSRAPPACCLLTSPTCRSSAPGERIKCHVHMIRTRKPCDIAVGSLTQMVCFPFRFGEKMLVLASNVLFIQLSDVGLKPFGRTELSFSSVQPLSRFAGREPQQRLLLFRLAGQNGGSVALLVQQFALRFPPGFVPEVSTPWHETLNGPEPKRLSREAAGIRVSFLRLSHLVIT